MVCNSKKQRKFTQSICEFIIIYIKHFLVMYNIVLILLIGTEHRACHTGYTAQATVGAVCQIRSRLPGVRKRNRIMFAAKYDCQWIRTHRVEGKSVTANR